MAVSKTMAASVAVNRATNIAKQVVSKTTKYQQSIALNNNWDIQKHLMNSAHLVLHMQL